MMDDYKYRRDFIGVLQSINKQLGKLVELIEEQNDIMLFECDCIKEVDTAQDYECCSCKGEDA